MIKTFDQYKNNKLIGCKSILKNFKFTEPERNYTEEDPYGEEVWEKKRNNKILRPFEDPYGEEDWGWENESDFNDKYLIYKMKSYNNKPVYFFSLLTGSNRIFMGRDINLELRETNYRKIEPLTLREIKRIQEDKIHLIPYGISFRLGQYKRKNSSGYSPLKDRIKYSELKKYCLFLDQDYYDNYINENFIYEGIRWYEKGKLLQGEENENIYDDFITNDNFRKFLIENEIYEKYIYNCENFYIDIESRFPQIFIARENVEKDFMKNFSSIEPDGYIYWAFTWSNTVEGHSFWFNIDQKWKLILHTNKKI